MRNRATTPLKRPKLRQSWSKYNLFNISLAQPPQDRFVKPFAQKWKAKAVLRHYHGEQVKEGQWKRMFRRTLRSVIPMNPSYLATNDGSLESAGRGMGLTEQEITLGKKRRSVPYMQMTFAPLERRLDTAIFRAMFASSARQARQFVVHGGVKVNGKPMRFPGYLLNPGDLFQVEPERVMYATGAPKQTAEGELGSRKPAEAESDGIEATPESEVPADAASQESVIQEDDEREPRDVLKDLLSQARGILSGSRDTLSAKRKQDLRGFSSTVKRLLSRSTSSTILTDSLEAQFQEIQQQLKLSKEKKKQDKVADVSKQTKGPGAASTEGAPDGSAVAELAEDMEGAQLDDTITISDHDYRQLFQAFKEAQDNPVDDSKPYATPWRPRDYMSAFAHIPRYLEVNQNICAAVYVRHPVARPGLGEIPTPFSELTSGAAFNWYLRRR